MATWVSCVSLWSAWTRVPLVSLKKRKKMTRLNCFLHIKCFIRWPSFRTSGPSSGQTQVNQEVRKRGRLIKHFMWKKQFNLVILCPHTYLHWKKKWFTTITNVVYFVKLLTKMRYNESLQPY